MTDGNKLGLVLNHADELLELSEKIKDIDFSLIDKAASIDTEVVDNVASALESILKYKKDIDTVERGLESIQKVVSIQNQVEYVSAIRDSISVVAGSIDDIKTVAEYKDRISCAVAMKPMIEEVLALSEKMDRLFDIEPKIDKFLEQFEMISSDLEQAGMMYEEMQSNIKEMRVLSGRVGSNLNETKELQADIKKMLDRVTDMSIETHFVPWEDQSRSEYNPETNTLKLWIREGKQGPRGKYKGDKGEPGRDGADFKPSFYGKLSERVRYGHMPMGTSFLSLDEIPTMIYFKRSDNRNDWTDGQPFGVSNGGYSDDENGIDIIDGINVDALTDHVIANMKRRNEDGR